MASCLRLVPEDVMLIRRLLSTLLLVAVAQVTPAYAGSGPGPVTVSGDNKDGAVTTTVTDPGTHGSAQTVIVSGAGASNACTWMQMFAWERLPLPPESVVHGTYWIRYCNNQGFDGAPVFVPDSATNNPAAIVTPGLVAQHALNELRLPSPEAAHNPVGDATTNLAVWFWIPQSQWQSLSQTTRAGNVWARVTATPVSTSWDPGDGSAPVVCRGPGTPYDRSRPADQQSSDCTHTYTRSSASQPQTGPDSNDRFFTVRVSVVWRVTWVGVAGAAGQLPDLTRVASFQLRVDDREAVVTSSG